MVKVGKHVTFKTHDDIKHKSECIMFDLNVSCLPTLII